MIAFAAFITGLLSTILLMALWLAFLGAMTIAHTNPTFFIVSFFVLLVGSIYVIAGGAGSASAVWARGSLVGAVEWMIVGLAIVGGTFGGLISAVERDASPSAFGGAVIASGFITA